MRPKNAVRTERAQLSLSDTTNRVLEQLAQIGILGKTKAEIATRIVTDWIWQNEDRLSRQGISLRSDRGRKGQKKKMRVKL
jgi:hypothetical protein